MAPALVEGSGKGIALESGFAALDRGEGIRGTVDEHMSRIDAAVRARVAARAGK